MNRTLPRRDRVYLAGARARLLSDATAAAAWLDLAGRLEDLGQMDVPKFRDLLRAIRQATITARRMHLSVVIDEKRIPPEILGDLVNHCVYQHLKQTRRKP